MQEATFLILTALSAESQHGYGIITDVEQIHAQHILTTTKEGAEQIRQMLDKGADFTQLANEQPDALLVKNASLLLSRVEVCQHRQLGLVAQQDIHPGKGATCQTTRLRR